MYYVCVCFILFLLKQRANTALSREKKNNSYGQGASHSTFLHGPNPKCCTTALSQGCQSEPWVIQKANLAFFRILRRFTWESVRGYSSSMRCWVFIRCWPTSYFYVTLWNSWFPKKQTGKSEFTRRIHLKSPKGGNINPKSHILHLCLRTIHSNPLQFCRFFLPFVTPRKLEWLRTSPRQGPVMLARAARPAVQCRGTPGQIERAMPSSHGGKVIPCCKRKSSPSWKTLFYPGKSENDFNLHSSWFLVVSSLLFYRTSENSMLCFYLGGSSPPKASLTFLSNMFLLDSHGCVIWTWSWFICLLWYPNKIPSGKLT